MAVPPKGSSPGGAGWKTAGIVGGLILLLIVFSNRGTNSSSADYGGSAAVERTAPAAAPAAAPSIAYEELVPANVQRGNAHFRLATRDEGLVGARIYSENCYTALARGFSWTKLDQCGGADMAAVALAGEGKGSISDASYFEPETAASRYLQAAIGGGAPPEAADRRLSGLQALVARLRPARPKAEVAAPVEDASPEEDLPLDDVGAPEVEAAANAALPKPGEPDDPDLRGD